MMSRIASLGDFPACRIASTCLCDWHFDPMLARASASNGAAVPTPLRHNSHVRHDFAEANILCLARFPTKAIAAERAQCK